MAGPETAGKGLKTNYRKNKPSDTGELSGLKVIATYETSKGIVVSVRGLAGQFDRTRPEQAQPRPIDQSRHPWQPREE